MILCFSENNKIIFWQKTKELNQRNEELLRNVTCHWLKRHSSPHFLFCPKASWQQVRFLPEIMVIIRKSSNFWKMHLFLLKGKKTCYIPFQQILSSRVILICDNE